MVVLVTFMVALISGYNFPSELDWLFGHRINFRTEAYVPAHPTLSMQHRAFLKIFTFNTAATLQILVLGTIVFLFPWIRISAIGYSLGASFWGVNSPLLCCKFFLPHSLIELPVLIYACAISLSSGLKWLTGGAEGRWNIFKREFVTNLKLFLLLIPFILLAALLEAYVTYRWC
jgi:uncharacterized membrane protein SpoIIM required for sporulation